jgi:hypothetical protein
VSSGVYTNPRNGHRTTTHGATWQCDCGKRGTQPDEQRAQIAAQFHIRHPERTVHTIQ